MPYSRHKCTKCEVTKLKKYFIFKDKVSDLICNTCRKIFEKYNVYLPEGQNKSEFLAMKRNIKKMNYQREKHGSSLSADEPNQRLKRLEFV